MLLALNVVQIDIPPLRSRPADLPLLAERYLAFFTQQGNHRNILGFTPEALHVLTPAPLARRVTSANSRNLVERAVLLCTGEYIGVSHLPPNLLNTPSSVQRSATWFPSPRWKNCTSAGW